MIFSSDGDDMTKVGNMDFFSKGKSQQHVGNMIFSDDKSSTKIGNILSTPKGSVVKSGDMFHAPDGTYTRFGNTLFGPDGKTYTGVKSDDDAWSIVNHRNSLC